MIRRVFPFIRKVCLYHRVQFSYFHLNKIIFKIMQEQNKEIEEATAQTEQAKSKKQLNREKKEAEKEAKKKEKQSQQQNQAEKQEEGPDPLANNYGDLPLIQSQYRTDRKWVKVRELDAALIGKEVLVRARVHNSRVKGKLGFIVLRETFYTAQVVAQLSESISKQMLKYVEGISLESIVDVTAVVVASKEEIKSCSQKNIELILKTIHTVSRSAPQLPFQIEDASRRITNFEDGTEEPEKAQEEVQENQNEKKEKQNIQVMLKTRLDNRIIDMRTPAKQAIFRVQSGVQLLFREFLLQNEFVEIHTPKLIGGASEGGTNVFKLKYFGQDCCLAQSPQLYKQMCLMGDFDRVFEVAPVFRAENSNTHRHMCEFNSMDIEMVIKENFMELLDLMGDLCVYMFKGIEQRYAREIQAISEQFPFEPFKIKEPIVKLTFEEGCKLLAEAGIEWSVNEDLDTKTEKKLGELVRQKFDTDFYILHRYPKSARPFYTMPCPDDANFTLSYDFFMRGEEIVSGAQRIHDPVMLENNIKGKNINIDTLREYVDSFKFGAFPHGGCAFGLERVVFLYFNLRNIRNACMFPRDPARLYP